jgi:hypothetical protein
VKGGSEQFIRRWRLMEEDTIMVNLQQVTDANTRRNSTVYVPKWETVKHFRKLIRRVVPSDHGWLSCGNVQLEDSRTLESYGIGNNSIIRWVRRYDGA